MRLLVVHPGGVGDVLLALPAVRTLHRQYGAHEVGLLAARQVGWLLRDCGEVDTVFPLESGALAELLGGAPAGTSPFLTWLTQCKAVQCWMEDSTGTLRGMLTSLGIQNVVIGSPMSHGWKGRHQAERFLEAAGCPSFEPESDRPLQVTRAMEALGRNASRKVGLPAHRPYAVMHPGSGSIHKCCHVSLFVSILDWLIDQDLSPLIVEGPADEQPVKQLMEQRRGAMYVLKAHDLSTLAAVLRSAVFYVGHDSGITHLAAALGVPTLACFGPTNHGRWGPRGKSVTIVNGAPCRCVTWEAVRHCVDKPCLNISPSVVIHACENLVAVSRRNPRP